MSDAIYADIGLRAAKDIRRKGWIYIHLVTSDDERPNTQNLSTVIEIPKCEEGTIAWARNIILPPGRFSIKVVSKPKNLVKSFVLETRAALYEDLKNGP